MYINLSNEELKIMNIQFIHKLLSNDYISLDTYKKWYKIINNYQDYQKIIFNNFNTMKKNKNIPNYHLYDLNEPNFIIITSGQSNAGGWGTKYNSDIPIDQPYNRIQSYDIEQKKWVVADLSNGSLGGFNQCRMPTQNLFAFQYAKHLIKNNKGIRPGIICYSCGNKPIGNWVKFKPDEEYYDENIRTCNGPNKNLPPGYLFEKIKDIYNDATLQLSSSYNKKINAIIWHQGESDILYNSNPIYYQIAFNKLIDQFSELSSNKLPAFIAGTILKNKNSDNINNIIRNTNNKRFYNFVELSNLNRNDSVHFTTIATRTGGKYYFDSYQKLIQENIE